MKLLHKVINLLIRWITPKEDVFLAFERFDAEITARDNERISANQGE